MRWVILLWFPVVVALGRGVETADNDEDELLIEHIPEPLEELNIKEKHHGETNPDKIGYNKSQNESTLMNHFTNLDPEPYDPYNPNHKPPVPEFDEDNMDHEYDGEYDSKKNHDADIEFQEEDNGPSKNIGSDHLLQPNADNLPLFLTEPKNSFVMKNKPATLKCRVANALKVYYKCNGAGLPCPKQFDFVDPQTGVRIVELDCNVTRNQVEEYFGPGRYRCECIAWTGNSKIRSQPAFVELAYLRKQFVSPPVPSNVEVYGQTALRCIGPEAAPPVHLSWLKNGSPLVSGAGSAALVSAEGHLLISQATLQDMANYTCVAENLAGKKLSDPVLLTVFENGGWSSWSQWTECKCPGQAARGQRRTRSCTNPPPLNGGQHCSGPAIQRSQDCLVCHNGAVGRWGSWSEWSRCGKDCRQVRRRQCLGSSGSASGDLSCPGRPLQLVPCTGGLCPEDAHGDHQVNSMNNAPLYIGLAVAVLIFGIMLYILYRFLRKQKIHHHSQYAKARPDSNQHMTKPTCYEYPSFLIKQPPKLSTRSSGEHHYDVPHLNNCYISPIDHQLPSSSESENYDKNPYSESENSTTSCFTNSDCMYDAVTNSVNFPLLPSAPNIFPDIITNSTTSMSQQVSSDGALLSLESVGVILSVPEGSILKGKNETFYIHIIRDDKYRPKVPEGTTQLSSIVKTGPGSINFNKSVILQIPHCANLKTGCWDLSIYALEQGTHHKDKIKTGWRKIIDVGQETINTSLYAQLDNDRLFLVTEYLSTFVLVGKSINGKAAKNLKMAAFAPIFSYMTTENYNIRVYIFEDIPYAFQYALEQEKRFGGILMDRPKNFIFHDGGSNMCFNIEEIGLGWKPKPGSSNQEISFNQIWNATSNILHCTFSLEQLDSIHHLKCKISAFQHNNPSYKQSFLISSSQDMKTNSLFGEKTNLVCNDQNLFSNEYSKDLKYALENVPLDENIDKIKQKNLILSENGVNTCLIDNTVPFQLPIVAKKQLSACLDLPNSKGNDWRLLAQELNVDRYINFFATKKSPTECILDLWECRNRDANAVSNLIMTLEKMGRRDAAEVVESCLKPSWL